MMVGDKMFKKLICLCMTISMLVSVGSISYAANDTNTAIDLLNEYRESVGVEPVDENYELRKTAENHTKYMSYHQSLSLVEESGTLYYRGRYTSDRAMYHQYEETFVNEMIINSNTTYRNNMKVLLENPYSRVLLLDPKYEDIGMMETSDYFSYIVGGGDRVKNQLITYPYNLQEDVPITWNNGYSLNPYSEFGLSSNNKGLPITYTYYAMEDNVDEVLVDEIRVKAITGEKKAFEFEVLSADNDKYLSHSVIILPTEELAYNTQYQISFDLDVYFDDGYRQESKKTIYFTTEKDPNGVEEEPVKTYMDQELLSREDFTVDIVNVMNYELLDGSRLIFDDVEEYEDYIYTAFRNNLIKGTSETTFSPNDNITREQAYTILVRAYESRTGKEMTYNPADTIKINDYLNVSSWARDNHCLLKAEDAGFLVLNSFNNIFSTYSVTGKEFNEILLLFIEALEAEN